MTSELMIVLALVLANGLFAGAEIAILSVRRTRIQERVQRGERGARAVEVLRSQPERFVATVQIGITVVGSAAAVFGGSTIAATLTPMLQAIGLDEHAHEVALVIVVVGLSFLSLVLGELVPKSLALRYSDRYAFVIGGPLLRLSQLVRPLVWLLTVSSNLVLRLFRDRTSFAEARISRDELRQLVGDAGRDGGVDLKDSELAARALELGDVAVSAVMVRRDRIVALSKTATADEIQRTLLEQGHSRMPVYDGELDRMIGYVVARDVLALVWEQGLVVLDDIVRPLFAVPRTARVNTVLREMQARRVQIAVVVDEHGGTAGIVTIEDLVEELVGDIANEHDELEQVVRAETETTALVAGWVPIHKVNRALHTALPIGRDSTTIAGLCMALALVVPASGMRLQAGDGTVLEVVDASPRRVRMVRVHHRRPEGELPEEPGALTTA
jgi:putative hemolysin